MARRANSVYGTIACAAAWLQAFGPSAAAEEAAQHDLKIERQSLARALQEFAKQSGVQIIFFSAVAGGREAPALEGRFTTRAALERLLDDSRLTFREIHPNTIEIFARTPAEPTQLAVPQHGPTPERDMNEAESGSKKSETGARRRSLHRMRSVPAVLLSAAAATAGAQSEPMGLEEIIVTAQKRVERLQDVPLAVTAISGDMLASAGVAGTSDLVNLAPSLTFAQGAHLNNSNFRIRGIGSALFGQGVEPSVSVVVDGIVLARSAQGFTDLADIERVEVLRGPQGTLFGKNSVGGVINVVTKRPSTAFEANVDATAAEGDEYRVRGSISGPLSDTVGARLTAYYNDVGGHIRNVTLDKDVGGSESFGVRGKLEWDPTDRLNLLFTADYREAEALCCSSVYLSVENALLEQLLLPAVANFNNLVEVENLSTWFESDQTSLSLEANLELDAVTLTSITAYQDFSNANNQPIDRLNTPTPIWLPVTNGYFDINGGTVDIQQYSQEFRVASAGQNAFNYVAGLYLFYMDLDRTFQRRSGGCAPGGTPAEHGQPCVVPQYRSQAGFLANTTTRNAALFGQVDFPLLGNLSGLVGARAQYEKIAYRGERTDTRLVEGDLPLLGNFGPSAGSGNADDSVVTGKAGLKYEFSRDAQTYLTWSTGYKGMGFETEFAATFEEQEPLRPEKARAWELGYKARLLDGMLTLNTALFHAKYTDLQVQANRGNADLGIVRFAATNAGSSTTKGAEVEFSLRPVPSFTLSGGVTYLDSSVDIDGLNCPLSFQNAAPVITGSAPINTCYRPAAGANPVQNVSGGSLPNAPEWRGSLTARYEFDIPGTSLASFVQLSGSTQTKFNFAIEQDPLLEHKGYTTVDASIGLRDQSERYRLTFFVKNLFDEHYATLLGRSATLTTAAVTPNNLTGIIPKEANRYFGATLGVSF